MQPNMDFQLSMFNLLLQFTITYILRETKKTGFIAIALKSVFLQAVRTLRSPFSVFQLEYTI